MRTILVVFIALYFIAGCSTHTESSTKPPNIVFIFADDQTFSAIHAFGNEEIYTPNLDQLVQNGTSFTHAYNMGSWSGAVCAASRAMLISGRSVWNANTFRKHWIKNDSLNKTWGKILSTHGYDTYMTGKWHVDAKAEKVFQHVKHVRPGMPNDNWDHATMVRKFDSLEMVQSNDYESIMPFGYNRPKHKNDTAWLPYNKHLGGFWEGGKHWSEVIKDDAISFLKQTKESENPFFMYVAFNAPHDPRQAPKEFLDMYDLDAISVPESFLPEYPHRHAIKNGNSLSDEALAPFPRTKHAIKTHLKEYYAIISHLDVQIGKILDALAETGKANNTYIVFTADHGLAMGKHGLLGKQNLFDHSIRVPMILAGPDIPKNKKIDADIYLQDAMATTLELAKIEKPDYVFFNSFLSLAKGKKQSSAYTTIYGAYLDVQRMIRKDNYKLLVYPNLKKTLLFDLKNDPEEMIDIANNPNQKERLKSLFSELLVLQNEMNDPLDLTSIYNNLN